MDPTQPSTTSNDSQNMEATEVNGTNGSTQPQATPGRAVYPQVTNTQMHNHVTPNAPNNIAAQGLNTVGQTPANTQNTTSGQQNQWVWNVPHYYGYYQPVAQTQPPENNGYNAAQVSYMPAYQFVQPTQVPQCTQTMVAPQPPPWGKPNIGAFLKGCADLTPFDGRNWEKYKFDFGLHCRSYGLKEFLEAPMPWGKGYPYPPKDSDLAREYKQMSVAVYNGIYNSCSEVLKYRIRSNSEGDYPASEAWQYLNHEYSNSDQQTDGSHLIHQLQSMKMELGKSDAYIAEMLKIRS